jgi:MYXO-CTERM domain-containing protein
MTTSAHLFTRNRGSESPPRCNPLKAAVRLFTVVLLLHVSSATASITYQIYSPVSWVDHSGNPVVASLSGWIETDLDYITGVYTPLTTADIISWSITATSTNMTPATFSLSSASGGLIMTHGGFTPGLAFTNTELTLIQAPANYTITFASLSPVNQVVWSDSKVSIVHGTVTEATGTPTAYEIGFNDNPPSPPVPEPTTVLIWALLGLAGAFCLRRRGAKV